MGGFDDVETITTADARTLSRETMLDLFRGDEVLPEGRTNEEEERLVGAGSNPSVAQSAVKI